MAKQLIKDYVFTPGNANVGTIKVPGRYTIDKLLLITNTTDNIIIYNFSDPAFAGTVATFTAGDDATYFPYVTQMHDGYTTITLAVSTASMSASDKIQIFAEQTEEIGTIVRPYAFGTDAIERMRVSQPESMIDADFEYGLQPTKWTGYGTVKGYPSTYELPGVDFTTTAITTDFNTTSATNSVITVTFSANHELVAGSVVNVTGLDRSRAGFSRADGSFVVLAAPSSTTITYFARGLVGTANAQSLLTDETLVKRGAFYASASIPVASATSNGSNPSTITLNFTNPHGLIAGTSIHTVVASGTNATLASGPFVILSTPSLTSLTYLARSSAAVTSPSSVTLYALSNASLIHRSQDGGVILQTKTPTYAATVVRQSKKYFRYQSGKGFMWSSGTLFKPNYDLQAVTSSGTIIGSTITVVTDDIDHGLQVGATILLAGITTSGYNGSYTVASIVDDYSFTVTSTATLGATNAVLGLEPYMSVTYWDGAAVRAGMFDEQNGLFFECDGSSGLFVCRRNSTLQISGSIGVTLDSNAVTGTNTRFTEQLRAGDRIVLRGMTHFVTQVVSNTSMYVTPDYRGITASGIKGNVIRDLKIPQAKWNLDPCDGTGPSGFTLDLNKMQMIGMQYSWYGAGFVDFMVRGPNGNWVYCHRMKNNNVNREAYMRSGNLPVRYSIENDAPVTYLTGAMTAIQTTVPIAELDYFPDAGVIYIDNEFISYTAKSASTGAGNLTGCTRAATLTQYQQGTTNNLTAGTAAVHANNVGIILVSNTCSPTLSHWGSALIIDGGFTTDRGYLFNYQRTSFSLTTGTKTAFLLRLAPSVDNSLVGRLGAKDLLNRSQLLLQTLSTACSGGTSSGALVVEGVLNPKNFVDATWSSLNAETVGGQPSFAQVATSVTWSGVTTFALPGEQIFAFTAPSSTDGSVQAELDLSALKELVGAPLGGDFKYPDGSDILAVNVRMTAGSGNGHILLRWSEAQA